MDKAIKTIDPLAGALAIMNVMTGQTKVDRSDVFNTKIGDIVIDTVCAFDTHTWETGIKRGDWIIVEQYETRELAEKGHQEWVKKIEENPNLELEDINLWNL